MNAQARSKQFPSPATLRRAGKKQPALLLVGGGHAHVEVVRRLGLAKAAVDVTLVSSAARTPYSGLLPAYVAGNIHLDDLHIDLAPLCRRAGVRFVTASAVRLDAVKHELYLDDGQVVSFDLLSLDVGSQPALPQGAETGIATKPIAGFAARIACIEQRIRKAEAPFRIAVVGAGLAGIEIAFALRARSIHALGCEARARRAVTITLIGRNAGLVPDRGVRAGRLVAAALRRRAIAFIDGVDVAGREVDGLVDRDGQTVHQADEIVWATTSVAPGWLKGSGLALNEHGFVRVDDALRSISHPFVFAAGDIAALAALRPKAGVFAVRAGPILAANLLSAAAGRRLRAWRPQRHWLAILSTADGSAIATKYGLAVHGRWVQRWKDVIDRRFIHRYKVGGPAREKR